MRLLALLFFCLWLVAGCCSVPEGYRPVVEFQRQHPTEFKKFKYLNPISLDTYKAIWGERAGATSDILGETDRRFGSEPAVKDFVKTMLQRESEDRQRILEFCRELEMASAGGGVICQYEWCDGETRETGFLVLKFGKVIKREPWITDFLLK